MLVGVAITARDGPQRTELVYTIRAKEKRAQSQFRRVGELATRIAMAGTGRRTSIKLAVITASQM